MPCVPSQASPSRRRLPNLNQRRPLLPQVHKIAYVSLTGGHRAVRAAIQRFNDDDSARVFLLSLREGAAGLTLVRSR